MLKGRTNITNVEQNVSSAYKERERPTMNLLKKSIELLSKPSRTAAEIDSVKGHVSEEIFAKLKKLLSVREEDEEYLAEAIVQFVEDHGEDDLGLVLDVAEDSKDALGELIDDFDPSPDYHVGEPLKIGNYLVYRSYGAAERAAVDYVRQMLDDEPESFNQDWLSGQVDSDKMRRFFRDVYQEMDYSYAEDIQNESASDPDFENRLEEEMAEMGVDNIDDFVEGSVMEKLSDEDGYGYYESEFGKDEAKKLIMDNNLIDIDKAAEAAVDEDGWAHFLSGYDGNYSDLPSGAVYFQES